MIKKLHLFLTFLIGGFFCLNLQAQKEYVPFYSNLGTTALSVLGTSSYHVSEHLYRNSELGVNSFTVSPIQMLSLNVATLGSIPNFGNVKIYLKNVDASQNTLAAATYSTAGYTEVFSGSLNLANTGWYYILLNTPFTRVAGNNLMMMIERTDNVAHPNYVFIASLDLPAAATNTCRRYNGTTEISGATALDASSFRAAVQFLSLHTNDAVTTVISNPVNAATCYSGLQNISVGVLNIGSTTIAPGAATIELRIGDPNRSVYSTTNSGNILPGQTALVQFAGISLNNPGYVEDTAIVMLPGDGEHLNDSAFSEVRVASTLQASNTSTLTEGAEADFSVISWIDLVQGTRALWRVVPSPPNYGNSDLTGELPAHGGANMFLFDSWSGTSSSGFVGRLYTNCITFLGSPGTCASNLSFYMSHDNSYSTNRDSLYISVSTNKGASWTRLSPGFARYDAAAATPTWRQENVNLSAYNGQTIQIGFEGVSKYGNVIGLDDVTITSGCTLPVTNLDFVGYRSNDVNLLKWSTRTETNNAGFALQRSADGTEFSNIGTIASKATNGNSNSLLTYNYTDSKPMNGSNYYRLKQTDFDGKVNYSKTILIDGGKITSFSLTRVTPNPARDKVFASVDAPNAGVMTFRITDATGRLLLQQVTQVNTGENQVQLNISNLRGGTYFIKAVCADGCDAGVKRFIKE